MSLEWKISDCAKMHPLGCLRDYVYVAGVGVGAGWEEMKGGKSGGDEGEKEEDRGHEKLMLGRLKKLSAPWEPDFNQ